MLIYARSAVKCLFCKVSLHELCINSDIHGAATKMCAHNANRNSAFSAPKANNQSEPMTPGGRDCQIWETAWGIGGDSTWLLASEAELAAAQDRVETMHQQETIDQFLARREDLRRMIGQSTFLCGRK